jgi:hypothetical protein
MVNSFSTIGGAKLHEMLEHMARECGLMERERAVRGNAILDFTLKLCCKFK